MKKKKIKPRGIRNNNPLNIRLSNDRWEGAADTQTDTAFVQFTQPKYGYRAAWKILQTYYTLFREQGKDFNVRNIISRWAPPEDQNNTEAYIQEVMRLGSLGGHEQLLPPQNPVSYIRLSRLISAMASIENGIPESEVDTEDICQGYKLAFPKNVIKLNRVLREQDEYWLWHEPLSEEYFEDLDLLPEV